MNEQTEPKVVDIKSERQRILDAMSQMDPASSKYTALVKNLSELDHIRSKGFNRYNIELVGKLLNTLHLVGILGYEKSDIITTKAFGALFKRN